MASKRKRNSVCASRSQYRIARTRTDLADEMISYDVPQVADNIPNSDLDVPNSLAIIDDISNVEPLHSVVDDSIDVEVHSDEFSLFSSDTESNNNVRDSSPESSTFNFPTTTNDHASENFQSHLACWAIKFNIPHVALNALLLLLKMFFDATLPSNARTLLDTPRQLHIKTIEPGQYFHIGIIKAVTKLLAKNNLAHLTPASGIKICVNIDGLPIAKSSSNQLWPILCNLQGNVNNVELIGVYQGFDKPKEPNIFLNDFVQEAIFLTNNGFTFNGKIFPFEIAAFVCDAPAKAFIKKTKGHAGYSSCTKCYTVGNFVENRVCFPQIANLKHRTNQEFRNKVDEDHHTGTTILESIPGLNMIAAFPLDYMHLICLGVMRKLLLMWVTGKPPTKLQHIKVQNISQALIKQRPFSPCEFARKPRSLYEVNRFKATEYRQFLLYTGPVILRSILSLDMYTNFLSLHIATLILSNTKLLSHFGDYSDSLLKYFVKTFILIYGEQNVSHNIHNLLHIFADSKQFGVLQNFCSFPFENYLQSFKRMIRKGDKPLSQIIKRKFEQDSCVIVENSFCCGYPIPSMEHNNGPLIGNGVLTQYKQIQFQNYTLKLSMGDNCCCLNDGNVICIKNFVSKDDELFIIGFKYMERSEVYLKPCKSSSLGIYFVSGEGSLNIWNIKNISNKLVKVIVNDKIAVFPFLH
uniref:DUF4218 domain-containing protein n=1 Tax=Photinus pyralis TaxID=7054 RepID=A0A1Y1MBE4_PHOPY